MIKRKKPCPYCDRTHRHAEDCPRDEVRTHERSEGQRISDGAEMLEDDYRSDYEREELADPHHYE